MSLRDFMNWFEGFSENIEDAPTPKQWEKIKDRLSLLKDCGEAQFITVPVPGELDPNVGGTHTTAIWRKKVKASLEELGYDPDSAMEVLATIPTDLNADPGAIARQYANLA